MSSSLRDQLAARRGQKQAPNDALLEDRTVDSQMRRVVRTGKLDISSFNLKRIPPEVYTNLLGISARTLSTPPDEPVKEQRYGDVPEVVALNASENEISNLDIEVGYFGGLKSINLRSNQLTSLPNSFADLLRLTEVDLSHNRLTALPPALLLLPALETLNLSHNAISSLDLSSPIEASDEGLSYSAGFLSTSFSRGQKPSKAILPVLKSLDLSLNKIDSEGIQALNLSTGLPKLQTLNLAGNSLRGTLQIDECGMDKMPELKTLVLDGNKYLQGVDGNLPASVSVSTDGCGAPDGDQPASSKPQPRANSGAGAKPIPIPPDMTITYRTCPAASFDDLPLDIQFDLYLPPTPSPSGRPHPLVIWFHGGGLLQGNKENLPPHFRRLPRHAYPSPKGDEHVAVISPNYRLAPQAPILDILSDVSALHQFVRTKLNDRLAKSGSKSQIDIERICYSGGSAGGYLALMAGLKVARNASEEDVGGYRGETGVDGSGNGVKCIAPFYPITDLTDEFWATETNPVPWMSTSVTHDQAKPHINTKLTPIATTPSGGPRSVLYAYMLQHALFPSLLFMTQKSFGRGLDTFRPDALHLSIPYRLEAANKAGVEQKPIYLIYGDVDFAVQKFGKTEEALRGIPTGGKEGEGEVVKIEVRKGLNHAFDESDEEECEGFREWLGKTLI